MAVWKYACKTIQGMNLDLKIVGREDLPLRLTRAVSGSGNISPTQLMRITDITEPVQELQLLDVIERIAENTVRVPVILRNSNVKKKYNMFQIGIFAEDPDLGEILYIILQSEGAEEIPSAAEMKDFKLEWYVNLSVGNADNIEVMIDETGVLTVEQGDARYASLTEYRTVVDNLNRDVENLDSSKVDKKVFETFVDENQEEMDKRVDESGNSNSATKLKTPRTIQTNLGSTSAESFDGSKNITPGVTGVLPVSNGGTGKDTAKDAANVLVSALDNSTTDTVTDDYVFITSSSGANYVKKKLSSLWEYVKNKIQTVEVTLDKINFNIKGNNKGFWVKNEDETNAIWLGINTSRKSRGLWDTALSKFWAYIDDDNKAHFAGNADTATKLKGCVASHGTGTNLYNKIAEINISDVNYDESITFLVSAGHADAAKAVGILTAHFRTSSTGTKESCHLVWNFANSYIKTENFYLVYNNTKPINVQLWIKHDIDYQGFSFDVLSEKTRIARTNDWTLYDVKDSNAVSALPTGYTVLQSSLADILNNVNTASKLATARTIGLSGAVTGSGSFDGSGNLSILASRKQCNLGYEASSVNAFGKFAEITVNAAVQDRYIYFFVDTGGFGGALKYTGILSAHFRTGNSKEWNSGQLVWNLANTSVAKENFYILHKTNTDGSLNVQLWAKCSTAYQGYHFTVLNEGIRSYSQSVWTLSSVSAANLVSSLPADYTAIQSEIVDILNNAPVPDRLGTKCKTVTDWNDATENGWYMGQAATNGPNITNDPNKWLYGTVIAYSTNYVRQILYQFSTETSINANAATCDRWERIKLNGTWGVWVNTSLRNYLKYSNVFKGDGIAVTKQQFSGGEYGVIIDRDRLEPTLIASATYGTNGSFRGDDYKKYSYLILILYSTGDPSKKALASTTIPVIDSDSFQYAVAEYILGISGSSIQKVYANVMFSDYGSISVLTQGYTISGTSKVRYYADLYGVI